MGGKAPHLKGGLGAKPPSLGNFRMYGNFVISLSLGSARAGPEWGL